MDTEERISVEVQADFMKRQTEAKPIPALSELIWNSLDGDANQISIELKNNDLSGGLSQIIVSDDGVGFSHDDAHEYFKNLGGSWKRNKRQTCKEGRQVHGQDGRGRYKVLALGGIATWKICYAQRDQRYSFEIKMREQDIKGVLITTTKLATEQSTGVVVIIDNLRRNFTSLSNDAGFQEINEIFAPYLINYKKVQIDINGKKLDPQAAIASRKEIRLNPIIDDNGEEHNVSLQVIEWHRKTKRTLYLCSTDGFPYDQVGEQFRVIEFYFSAYLRSTYITKLYIAGLLGLAEMDEKLQIAIEAAQNEIRKLSRERAAENAQQVVEEWKQQRIYPFDGEATTPIDRAEREVFDIVAVNLQNYTPGLDKAPAESKEIHLRMLRTAIARSPDELQVIFSKVVQLPKEKQQELATLLKETTLAAIITASKTVADRLKFIAGLESIVFDIKTKEKLRERSQLQKILAENTWIFGEEYNLWVSDKGLQKVLKKYRDVFDSDISIEEPVKVYEKSSAIVDFMFSRQMQRHSPTNYENLIVELKAPKHRLNSNDVGQIRRYAQAVSADERFHTIPGIKWNFWLVSNEIDDMVQFEIDGGPDKLQRLIYHNQNRNIKVGVKTWSELIEENRARLQFFQEKLEYTVEEDEGRNFLHKKHAELLKGVI